MFYACFNVLFYESKTKTCYHYFYLQINVSTSIGYGTTDRR